MRSIVLSLFFCLAITISFAQTEDTIVYKIADEMPRFPGCEQLDTTLAFKKKCAQQSLLAFIYSNVRYPMEAQQEGIEGTVVLNFIVEKDGTISNPNIVRDIGGGCGEEALRVVSGMNGAGAVWTPGLNKDGNPIRVSFNLPVKFKIEEAPEFTILDRDSVWTVFDKALIFKDGDEGLRKHIGERLEYPATGVDSCQIGMIDVKILVRSNGDVRILDLTDYNELGFDFWYEAIDASTSTIGKWDIAERNGRKVSSAYDLSMTFAPVEEQCQEAVATYEKSRQLAAEGQELFAKDTDEDKEAGIQKMTEAIELVPNDANLLYARGQAYLDMQRFEEACTDLTMVRRITLVNWFDNILMIVCSNN